VENGEKVCTKYVADLLVWEAFGADK